MIAKLINDFAVIWLLGMPVAFLVYWFTTDEYESDFAVMFTLLWPAFMCIELWDQYFDKEGK